MLLEVEQRHFIVTAGGTELPANESIADRYSEGGTSKRTRADTGRGYIGTRHGI